MSFTMLWKCYTDFNISVNRRASEGVSSLFSQQFQVEMSDLRFSSSVSI